MSTSPITVLCVDDNLAVAESLRCFVETEPDLQWLGHAPSADGLLEMVQALSPDVLLLDLAMPGREPLEALEEVQEHVPDIRAIVLSGYLTADCVQRALDAGAWGYIAKHEPPQHILATIRRVATGETAFPPGALTADPGNLSG